MLADFEKLEKPEEFFSDEKKIKKELYERLFSAVEILVSGKKDIPVAFSGGLDSSIMAYITSKFSRPILFCIGFKDSHDVINAQRSAKLLGFDLNAIYLEDLELNKYLEKTVSLVGTDDRLTTDLNVPFFIVKIDPNLKIKNGVQKYILRETFRKYLPKEIVERKKKSFQYGSGIHKALKKISKNRFDKSSRCFEEII